MGCQEEPSNEKFIIIESIHGMGCPNMQSIVETKYLLRGNV